MQVYFGWRKICLEFAKRMDPELPFYYFTTSAHRFYEGKMPSFNQAPAKPKTARRPPRRELMGSVGRRVSLPVRGSLSVRATFHNVPVDIPPPPSVSSNERILSKHSYASDGPR